VKKLTRSPCWSSYEAENGSCLDTLREKSNDRLANAKQPLYTDKATFVGTESWGLENIDGGR